MQTAGSSHPIWAASLVISQTIRNLCHLAAQRGKIAEIRILCYKYQHKA